MARKRKRKPEILYRVITYSTFDEKEGREMNMEQPKQVARTLNALHLDGWYVLWAFNTQYRIELLLCKEIGRMTERERLAEKEAKLNEYLKEKPMWGYHHDWEMDW